MAEAMQDNSALIQMLLGQFQGGSSSSSTSGSSTTSNNINMQGMQRLLDGLLQQGGLSDILASGAKSGIYNSSTQGLLANDLIARSAGEVAARSAGTTTTQSQNQNQSRPAGITQTDWGALAGAGGAALLAQILGPSAGRAVNMIPGSQGNGLAGVGNSIADLIFGSDSGTADPMIGPQLPTESAGDTYDSYDYQEVGNWWDDFSNWWGD